MGAESWIPGIQSESRVVLHQRLPDLPVTDSQFLIKMADSTKVTPFKIRLRKIASFIAEVEQFDVEDGVRKLRETIKKGKHAN